MRRKFGRSQNGTLAVKFGVHDTQVAWTGEAIAMNPFIYAAIIIIEHITLNCHFPWPSDGFLKDRTSMIISKYLAYENKEFQCIEIPVVRFPTPFWDTL
jgi:hypothetical protein